MMPRATVRADDRDDCDDHDQRADITHAPTLTRFESEYYPGTPRLQEALATGSPLLPVPTATSHPGAVYEGLLVGASAGGHVVQPVSARWPDRNGRFELVLPASVRGKQLRLWETNLEAYATNGATAGGLVELGSWPTALTPRVATGVAQLVLPR